MGTLCSRKRLKKTTNTVIPSENPQTKQEEKPQRSKEEDPKNSKFFFEYQQIEGKVYEEQKPEQASAVTNECSNIKESSKVKGIANRILLQDQRTKKLEYQSKVENLPETQPRNFVYQQNQLQNQDNTQGFQKPYQNTILENNFNNQGHIGTKQVVLEVRHLQPDFTLVKQGQSEGSSNNSISGREQRQNNEYIEYVKGFYDQSEHNSSLKSAMYSNPGSNSNHSSKYCNLPSQ